MAEADAVVWDGRDPAVRRVLALAALAPGNPTRDHLDAILRAARRAAEVFRELWERLGVAPPA